MLLKPEARMRAQLVRWRRKIDLLAEKAHAPGRLVSFDTLIHIDELKALHAVAQSKLDEFVLAVGTESARLEFETETAFSHLTVALEQRRPATRAPKRSGETVG
jgi:hypothetical protein